MRIPLVARPKLAIKLSHGASCHLNGSAEPVHISSGAQGDEFAEEHDEHQDLHAAGGPQGLAMPL